MKIEIEEKYGAVIVQLKGNVMGGPDAQSLHDTFHKLIDEGKKNIIVDLGDFKFMNSSGIGMLISGYTTVKNAGGNFIIARAADKIQSLLVITKLITVFEHYETLEEAIEAMKKK